MSSTSGMLNLSAAGAVRRMTAFSFLIDGGIPGVYATPV